VEGFEGALIAASGVHKHFGGVRALDDVSLEVLPAEIHALVGENGAGKSTLAKILAGVCSPDAGRLLIDGRATPFTGRRRMAALGVGYVPQSLSFVGTLSALDNHLLASSEFLLDRSHTLAVLQKTGALLGIEAPWRRPVQQLSLAERQLAEIVCAWASASSPGGACAGWAPRQNMAAMSQSASTSGRPIPRCRSACCRAAIGRSSWSGAKSTAARR
jgi:ABC-type sugar transport system ATPase subunit